MVNILGFKKIFGLKKFFGFKNFFGSIKNFKISIKIQTLSRFQVDHPTTTIAELSKKSEGDTFKRIFENITTRKYIILIS